MAETDPAARAAGTVPGLVLRPYAGEGDVPEMVRIQNAEWAADGIHDRETVEERLASHRHPTEHFVPERDITIAEVDGRVVAITRRDWVDTHDGVREYRSSGAVDPAWRRRGIGRTVLRENLRRHRGLAAEHESDRPRVHGFFVHDRNRGLVALAEDEGYRPARWFFDMRRVGLATDLPETPPLPDGLEVRPVAEDDLLTIWRADHEAFQDHWGGGDDSDEAFGRFRDSPAFDPTMWVVAWEGDEVAGAVVNAIYPGESEAAGERRGWLDSVFTRRRWRKRGLASALIARSLHVLAGRGLEVAMLGVDADNPSGAVRLYERLGFVANERATAYRRPMETA